MQLFHIKYEDDDEEDIALEELLTILREDQSSVVPCSRLPVSTYCTYKFWNRGVERSKSGSPEEAEHGSSTSPGQEEEGSTTTRG